MNFLVRRCLFRKSAEFIQTIASRNNFGHFVPNATINNGRCASSLCSSYYLFANLRRSTDNTTSAHCMSVRYKSNKKNGDRKQQKNYGEDSDEDSDAELAKFSESGSTDRNLIRIKVQSLRLDVLIKSSLRISRNKSEKLFYESKIRVNGRRITKKSISIREGDEIDIVKNVCPDNPQNLIISRIEVLSARADEEEELIIIVVKRFKSLTIENYAGVDCYKSSETN